MARLREISADVRRVLYSPEAYRCLPSWARKWSDGGCRTLQRAVMAWLGEAAEPWGMFPPEGFWREGTDPENAYHAGCVVAGRFWLDGEGLRRAGDAIDGDLFPSWLVLRPMPDPDTEHGYLEDPSTVRGDTLPGLVGLLEMGLGTREAFLERLPRA